MVLLVSVVSLAFILIGKKTWGQITNPVSMYSATWLFAMIANALLVINFGGFVVNDRVYIMILCTEIVFAIVCSAFDNKGYVIVSDTHLEDDIPINMTLLYICQIVALIIVLPKFMNTLGNFRSFGVAGIWNIRQEMVVGTSTQFILDDLIKNIFVLPVFTATLQVAFDALINGGKSKKNTRFLVIIAICDIALYSFTYMGRLMLLTTIVYFLVCFFSGGRWSGIDPAIKKKAKKYILIFLVGFVVVLTVLTQYRSISSTNGVAYTATAYLGGSLKYFDTCIDAIKSEGTLTYGSALFAGLWDNFLLVFQRVFGIDFQRPLEIVTSFNTPMRIIGSNNLYFTAFGTVLLNMYLDGRIFGVIFDSAVMAIVSMVIYRRFVFYPTRRNRLIANQMIMMLIWTMLYWDGNRFSSFMIFVYLILFTSRKRLNTVVRGKK